MPLLVRLTDSEVQVMDIHFNVPGGGGEIKIPFVISDGGRHIHEVVSELTPPFAPRPRARPN
jgi:hypothetical protein